MDPFALPGTDLLKKPAGHLPASKHDLLVHKKKEAPPLVGNGGGRPKPKKPIPEEPPPEPMAPPPVKAKEPPKVKLTDLHWGTDKAAFNDKLKVSVKAALPAGLENITKIEFKVIALTPDGKREDIGKFEAHLKDGKAEAEATLFFPQYRKDGKLPEECEYVFTAKHRDSVEEESKKLHVRQPFASNVRWDKGGKLELRPRKAA